MRAIGLIKHFLFFSVLVLLLPRLVALGVSELHPDFANSFDARGYEYRLASLDIDSPKVVANTSEYRSVKSVNWHRLTYKDIDKRVARDHLLLQAGYENWAKTHSPAMRGVHRQFAVTGMYDLLIKGYPYLSVGLGLGASWDNFYFKKALLDINANTTRTADVYESSGDYYDKSKITIIYAQVPLELRYTSNPLNYNKGVKVALGVKLGYLLRAYTKGVDKKNQQGQLLSKTKSLLRDRRLFSDFQAWGTFRVGWGNFHLFANYSLFPIFKLDAGPQAQVWSVGFGISGL